MSGGVETNYNMRISKKNNGMLKINMLFAGRFNHNHMESSPVTSATYKSSDE